jgi:glutathione synthase/RimK-type ligase-like ATP-grasp enzyme
MKTVLILFSGDESWEQEQPFESEKYVWYYENLYDFSAERGVQFYRASIDWYDWEKKEFTHAWTRKNGAWVRAAHIQPDIINDKTMVRDTIRLMPQLLELASQHRMVNTPEFSMLANNKLYTSMLFPNVSKPYVMVNSHQELQALVTTWGGERIVLKAAMESQGAAVQILQREQLDQLTIQFPLLAQEFVDTSAGIPGLIEGVHDLRLVYFGETLAYSYLRTPAEGKLVANVAMGGNKILIENHQIPDSVWPLVETVQTRFSAFPPSIYTIDLMFDGDVRPWLVELNTKPGMYFPPEQKQQMDAVNEQFVAFFKK